MCTELPNHANDTGIENVWYLCRQSRVLLGWFARGKYFIYVANVKETKVVASRT